MTPIKTVDHPMRVQGTLDYGGLNYEETAMRDRQQQRARAGFAVVLGLLIAVSLVPAAHGQMRGGAMRERGGDALSAGSGVSPDGVERRDAQVSASGLQAAFPAELDCEPIASAFASPYRYDGSSRRGDRNGGLHGGMDISLKNGTPLLAIASGEVIAVGEGGRLEGIFLWLRHAPSDTGMPHWVFSKYQHLAALPALKPGQRVNVGQPIALSGNSGTAGPHYGDAGYHHLHLSTFYAPGGHYALRGQYQSMLRAPGAVNDDPLILYAGSSGAAADVRAWPADRKTLNVPAIDDAGTIYPAGSKTVWPVRCKRK